MPPLEQGAPPGRFDRRVGDVVRRQPAVGARHVAHDDGRVARDMLADVARNHARFAICGMIEDYNTGSAHTLRYLLRIIGARIAIKGFIYTDYLAEMADFYRDMGGWIAGGQVTSRETVHEGIDSAPRAFLDLFSGGNIGKMLVKLVVN